MSNFVPNKVKPSEPERINSNININIKMMFKKLNLIYNTKKEDKKMLENFHHKCSDAIEKSWKIVNNLLNVNKYKWTTDKIEMELNTDEIQLKY